MGLVVRDRPFLQKKPTPRGLGPIPCVWWGGPCAGSAPATLAWAVLWLPAFRKLQAGRAGKLAPDLDPVTFRLTLAILRRHSWFSIAVIWGRLGWILRPFNHFSVSERRGRRSGEALGRHKRDFARPPPKRPSPVPPAATSCLGPGASCTVTALDAPGGGGVGPVATCEIGYEAKETME